MPLQSVLDFVAGNAPLFSGLSDVIWETPELGLREVRSSAALAEGRRSLRWFGASSYKAAPGGLPPSPVQPRGARLTTPPEWRQLSRQIRCPHVAFGPQMRPQPPGGYVSGPPRVRFRDGLVTRSPSQGGLCRQASGQSVSLLSAAQATRVWLFLGETDSR
jgi:hypothetical protein